MSETNTKFTNVERWVLLIMAPALVAALAIRMMIAYYGGVFNIPYILQVEAAIYILSIIIILLLCKNKVDKYSAQAIIISLGIVTAVAFVGVMFSDSTTAAVGKWFGTEDKNDTLQFLGWIIGGFTAFFGLFAFNRRAAAQDDTNRLTKTGHDQDRRKADAEQSARKQEHVQDRLKAAIDHLANLRTSGRIASFYEFLYLAKDVPDYAQNIFGILCAHLRHTRNAEDAEQERTESQTLVDILFFPREENPFSRFDYDLQRTKLCGIDFSKRYKPDGKVNFSNADLSESVFDKVDLSGINFRKAVLCKVKFRQTDLQKAVVADADLSGANLSNADLSEANFRGANLSDAKLFRAVLSNTDFRDAILCGVDFCETNLSKAKLSGAKYDKKTRFPKEFDRQGNHGMKYCFPDNVVEK